MKALLLFTLFISSAWAQKPSLLGTYTQKTCQKFEVADNFVAPDLVIEIEKSESFKISQVAEGIKIDGDTKYWNVAPIVFTKSGYYEDEEIKILKLEGGTAGFEVKYKVIGGMGAQTAKDIYEVIIHKQIDQSVRIKMRVKYKNLFTLGFWITVAEIDCTLRN